MVSLRAHPFHLTAGRAASLFLAAAAIALVPAAAAAQDDTRKEKQSVVKTSDGKIISSSALIKTINTKLDGKYQDLEIVIKSCQSGEFAERAAKATGGLKGNWSVSTASSSSRYCVNGRSKDDKDIPQKGQDGSTDNPGLKEGDRFYHGYAAQYIKKLQDDKNTVGNKALHETAENKNHKNTQPNYKSSGAVADNMTVHGGTKSNHAIILSAPASYGVAITDALYKGLKDAGYTDGEVNLLRGNGAPAGNVDGKATQAEFEKALDDMRTELDKNVGEEKAYVFIDAHGGYSSRTVAYRDGQADTPGGGIVVTAANPGLSIFADDPELISTLQEELPMFGGGVWADNPLIQREGEAFLLFTTFSETFIGSATTDIWVNGQFGGSLAMGNSAGADYQLFLSDTLLDSVMSDILLNGLLDIEFALPNAADSFQLAVLEDYLDPFVTTVDYGFSIGGTVGSEVTLVSEPTSVLLFGAGLIGLALVRRRWARAQAASGPWSATTS